MHTVEAEKKVNLSLILNLGLDLGEWSASCPKRFYPAEGTIEQEAGWAPEPVWTPWGQ
jgi:hypothetical protein